MQAHLNPINIDLEAMQQKSHQRPFSGEGNDIGKRFREWIEKRWAIIRTCPIPLKENKAMMGDLKLKSEQSFGGSITTKRTKSTYLVHVTWDYIKNELQKNYQTCTCKVEQLHKFIECSQGKNNLETFYQCFHKLLMYTSLGMTQEATVAQFVTKSYSPLVTRPHSLRVTAFSNMLDTGRPIEKVVNRN